MSYFDLPKFDLPDLAALGSQFGEAIAKAGADIEKAADDALGTSKKVQKEGPPSMPPSTSAGIDDVSKQPVTSSESEHAKTSPMQPVANLMSAEQEGKAEEPVKKKVVKKIVKKLVKKETTAAPSEAACLIEPSNLLQAAPPPPDPPVSVVSHPGPPSTSTEVIISDLPPVDVCPVEVVPADPLSTSSEPEAVSKADEMVQEGHLLQIEQLQALVDQLQKENEELAMRSSKISEQDLEEMREEYEERVGALDRKVYALTKERDALKKNSEKINELTNVLREKEEAIANLTREGEKLSTKQMDLEQHIKKVRQQCNAAEGERDKLKAKLEAESSELEAQRRTKARFEQELALAHEQARSDLESQRQTFEALLNKARADHLDAEERAKEAANQGLHRKVKEAESRAEALSEGVNELREALERQRQAADLREEMLKQDIADLERRCQSAELRHQDLTAKLPETTRPLLRQIEAMQAAATSQAETWAQAEEMLQARLEAAEERAAHAIEKERIANEKLSALTIRLSSSEGTLNALRSEIQSLRDQLDAAREGQALAEEKCRAAVEKAEEAEKIVEASAAHADQVAHAATEALKMEQRARETAESDALAASRDYEQRISRLEQQLQQHNFSSSGPDSHPSEPPARAGPGYRWVLVKEGENPPDPPPFHPASLPDVVPPSLVSDQSQGLNHLDDGFSFSSILGSHMGDQPFPLTSPSKPHSPFNNHGSFSRTSISGSAGPLLAADAEALRAALRLKLTEFAVLQDQVRELKLTRDQLAEELVKATQQSNMASEALETMSSLRQEVEASQAKYIAAVEMLGEKDEALEELRADLQDVKNLYRDQIEYLVNAVVAATPPSSPSPKQLNESGVAA